MNSRIRLARKSVLLGAVAPLVIAFAASPASAQPSVAPDETEVEELVVTGTLFRRTNTETASPVTVLSEETLKEAGITTVSSAIRSISADSAGSIGTGFQSGFSAGGSAVSLRGLGVSSTLVLIDGLRSTNFPINDDGHNAYVDLNSIPFSLVERIEVLKDGASSTYGADAIGGVVNLITRQRYQGVRGSAEFGQAQEGDAKHGRADLTVGYGDYDDIGWNLVLNAEYQADGRVTHANRGFPYNTRDLRPIGGLDNNRADDSLTTSTPNAVVTRVIQTDLSNPLAGMVGAPLTNQYQLLNPVCSFGTFTVTTGSAQGTGCRHNIEGEYYELVPKQDRWSYNGRLNVRLTDTIEAYATGSYSRSFVEIHRQPLNIRATQPFGASPTVASSNPGIVLPVYICSTGVSCATAPDRRLNPNNPFAAAFANDPANGAARIYYLFGDVPSGSSRKNEVIRGTAGFSGEVFGWDWRIDAVGAKDNLELTDFGYPNIANLLRAINTGSYNFVNPQLNTAEVRNSVLPAVTTPSTSSMYSLDASVTNTLMSLPGGDLQLALGAQVRKEKLVNNSRNPDLEFYTLNTSAAFGEHTVRAAYIEVLAPVHDMVEITLSGRYDDYSEGFSHFSPKVGVKFTPFRQFAIRGTWSEGFRAPTFAESNTRSSFAGFSSFTPPAAFQNLHGGLVSGGNNNPYAAAYNLGTGLVGNPDLEPEIATSYTIGFIAQPLSWLSMTADYYHVKKDGLIVAGPDVGDARAAYYAQTSSAAGCAAVAAIGPGYSCNTVDAPDPLFPAAMPRVLIINAPFVNSDFFETSGLDFSLTARANLPYNAQLTSRVDITKIFTAELHKSNGEVQKYPGTLGPYDLSSGNGTPDLRGSWQNTLEVGRVRLSTTTYFVDRIKAVATDQGSLSRDCVLHNLYTDNAEIARRFCYVKRFFSTDLNASFEVREGLSVYANVGNVFDRRAPVAPAAYSSAPNYLVSWHSAGLVGRTFKLGARFEF